MLEDNDIDVACVTETWMTEQKNHVTSLLSEAGYHIVHWNREVQKGGGIAIIYRHFLSVKKVKKL